MDIKKMVNYHNHTSLCGHASGTISEYIDRAIIKGIDEIGFSDHAPIPLELREGITMDPDETESYISSVLSNAESYSDKIDVRLGFEVDFPLFDTFNKKYFTDSRIDYLIGSCHFIGDWPFDHPDFIEEFSRRDIDDIYSDYFNIIADLVDSQLFNIVGHFDLVKKFGHRAVKDMSEQVRTISSKMAKYDTAAEINTSGLIKPVGEMYPSEEIVKIFFNENVPVTLGSDSHTPESVGAGFEKAVEMLKRTGYRKISGFKKRKRYDVLL